MKGRLKMMTLLLPAINREKCTTLRNQACASLAAVVAMICFSVLLGFSASLAASHEAAKVYITSVEE